MSTPAIATVTRAASLSPHLRRITLDVHGWTTSGVPDESVILHLPGAVDDHGDHTHPAQRHYTIRAARPAEGGCEVDIDVVVHGDGPGSTWGAAAEPGEQIGMAASKDYYGPPAGSTRRLLLSDHTGLPAVARILEQASAAEAFTVAIELPDSADRIDLPSAASVDVEWIVGGNGRPSRLLSTMERMGAPEPETYVWIACESAASRRMRAFVREHWTRDIAWYRIVGYWHGAQDEYIRAWHLATEEQRAEYERLWDPARPDEENWLEAEPFLQRMGL